MTIMLLSDHRAFPALRDQALPSLGIFTLHPTFNVEPIMNTPSVQRVHEAHSGVHVVIKSFEHKTGLDGRRFLPTYSRTLLNREATTLAQLHALGFAQAPYLVPRPLATDPERLLLITEWLPGQSWGSILETTLQTRNLGPLMAYVNTITGWLATLHRRTATTDKIDVTNAWEYWEKLLRQLREQELLNHSALANLRMLQVHWDASGVLHQGLRSMIHGDATPANMLFTAPEELALIDWERSRHDDPAIDIGCMVAELKHAFFNATGDPTAAEWLIRRVYDRYGLLSDFDQEEFAAFTQRGQFYMGCYLLRIARNEWFSWEYRQRLVAEAQACLVIR